MRRAYTKAMLQTPIFNGRGRGRRVGPAVLMMSIVAISPLSACKYPDRGKPLERLAADLDVLPRGAGYDSPEMRLGVMPFDAWYSPLSPLGVDDLGVHAYVAPGVEGDRSLETSRGVLFCADAGFLDIAHVRNAVDLTRFCFDHVTAGFYHGTYELELVGAEPDLYRITLTPPDVWRDLNEDTPQQTLDEVREASIQIAGRLAYLMTTWHEVITAYGYKGMGFVTEKPSAFSYDDAVSHRVGVEAAMQALRHDANLANFDRTVTATLHDSLLDLGVQPAELVEYWADRAEGAYWEGSEPKLRIIDLGMDDQPLVARVVDERLTPRRWKWSADDAVAGHRVGDLFDVQIELNIDEADKIYGALGTEARPIEPRHDFPALLDALRKELGVEEL